MPQNKLIIGREEWCSLPELGLPAIKAKVDSGARTSALHAFNVYTYKEEEKEYVKFEIHPIQGNRKIVKSCKAELSGRRAIKSSNGVVEKRLFIITTVKIGEEVWEIELTLTNRDSMGYRMLLGREAMRNKILVDPDNSFLLNKLDDNTISKIYCNSLSRGNSLNLVLLASNPQLYSNQRIMEAAIARGHNIEFISVSNCYINIKANVPVIYYRGGKELKNVDAVIPRLKPSMTFYGCALTKQFKALGAFCLNDAASISNSRDKLRCLQILANKGLDMPITSFANSPADSKHLIKMVGGPPLIVKLLEGTQGKGVVLAETHKAAESVISAFKSVKANILVQEFIKEAKGKDIRCFVIDGKVIGSMQREALDDDFRANLHLGGTASAIKLTKQEKKIAISAAKIMDLKVAGIDIIRSNSGPKILEVNSSPGLQGIEGVTKKDIAGLMIECIEQHIFGKLDNS